jgi:hypothetical protein
MKKNKLFLFVFAIAASFYSCDDAIDIRQPGEVNDPNVVYTDVNGLMRGLQGVYSTFSTESTIEFTSIFTDETSIGINNGGQGLNDGTYSFQLNAGSDAPQSIWGSNYATINFANRILDAATRITPVDDCEKAEYDYILAQLHAIRAFCHLQLVSYFSTDLKNDSALGVIILDVVPDENYNLFLPRNTNGEVYTFINKELTESAELFASAALTESGADCATTVVELGSKNKVTPNFITAVRARMAAYRGDYTNALTYANTVIAAVPDATFAQFPGIWSDTNNSGVIFELARVLGDFEIASYWYSQSTNINGSPFFEVSRSLYESYTPGDVRVGVSLIDPTSRISPDPSAEPDPKEGDVLLINKYQGNPAQGSNLINDIKVFRTAEMVLIRAEAYAAAGSYSGATNSVASELRDLRRRRFAANIPVPLPVITTATEAWAAILRERRLELAFEGHRYIDIKRLGTLAGGLGIERDPFDCALYNSCTLAPTDFRFTMPIPTTELTANPAIRGQQNPGY